MKLRRLITLFLGGYLLALGVKYLKMANSVQIDEENITSQYNQLPTSGVNKYSSMIRLVQNNSFFCSGVVIDGMYALTAAHCVSGFLGFMDKGAIDINNVDGTFTGVKAHAVALDHLRDVALLKGNFKEFKSEIPDFDGDSAQGVGNVLVTCGFPSGGKAYCTHLFIEGNYNFQISSKGGPIYKGMSGGPVFSLTSKKVIGLNSAVDGNHVIVAPLLGVGQIFQIRE